MLQGVPQGGVGDLDEALQGPVQLEDEEDSDGDRTRAHEQHREDGGIRRSEQPEADEEEGQPENQDEEERERELVLLLFNQQPAGLTQVVYDLLGLGEGLALGVVLRREFAQLPLNEFHAIGALEGGQRRHAGFLRGPDRFDAAREGALQLVAGGFRLRSVAGQDTVQEDEFGAALYNPAIHGVEGTLGGADQQTEHQRGERGDHAGAEFDDVLRFLIEMVAGQEPLQTQTEQGTREDAPRTR